MEGILGLSIERIIILSIYFLFIVGLIIFNLNSKKHKKHFIKDIKKSDVTLKEFLEDIKNMPRNLVDGGIRAYDEYKDILVHFVVNYFIISIVLDIIYKIPEGSILKIFVSLALMAHVGMWILWIGRDFMFGTDDQKWIFGCFLMIMFSTICLEIGIFNLLSQLILLIVIISSILFIIDLYNEVKKKKIKKEIKK
jgi:hypothetical protein